MDLIDALEQILGHDLPVNLVLCSKKLLLLLKLTDTIGQSLVHLFSLVDLLLIVGLTRV